MIDASPGKPGPKQQDDLITRLKAVRKMGSIQLNSENERNRALKWGRENRHHFVTRTHMGKLQLWRLT